VLAAATVTAGCGAAHQPGAGRGGVPPPSLATSLVTATGTWAVAVMGGSAASHNNFWQLFVRPAGASAWRLATPGVASNGGLVVASPGTGTVVAGFRPSQDLAYSPLAITDDNGAAWSPSILDAGLAGVPDALAAAPGSGRLLALLTSGGVEVSGPGGTAWAPLASHRALVTSAAARRCGLGRLTAAAFSPSGIPLVAGTCARPRVAGIFGYAHGTWYLAGPALPAAYRHQAISVLRLTTTAGGTAALLAAGSGPGSRLLAAWSTGDQWALSRPLPVGGGVVTSASFGPGGTIAVRLPGSRGEALAGTAGSWRPLPGLPPGTAVIAPGPAGGWDALAVHRATLTVWRLPPAARAWAVTQVSHVPIQYGSSG
jgi:hypothetical protein